MNSPIKKEDFAEPLTGTIVNNRKIIGVQRSHQSLTYLNAPDGTSARAWQIGNVITAALSEFTLDPVFRRDSIRFESRIKDLVSVELQTSLINPDDWFAIDIYTADDSRNNLRHPATDPSDSQTASTPSSNYTWATFEVTWTCRIAGVHCPTAYEPRPPVDQPNRSQGWFDDYSSALNGHEVVAVLIINAIAVLTVLLLMVYSRNWYPNSVRGGLLLAFMVFVAPIASVLLYDKFDGKPFSDQPLVPSILLLIFIIVFAFLVVGFIAKLVHRQTEPLS